MIENINFGKEISLGIFIGGLFIIMNAIFGIVIGIPLLAFSSETEKYTIVSGVAPLVEEGTFRAFLPFILITIGIPFILAGVISTISFVLYHFAAYGASITAASSLFFGAMVFGGIAFLMTYYNSNIEDFQVPLAAIVAHAVINTWLIIKLIGFIIIGSS